MTQFLQRVYTFCTYVGRPVHGEPSTGEVFRMGCRAAWAVAGCIHRRPRPSAPTRGVRINGRDA